MRSNDMQRRRQRSSSRYSAFARCSQGLTRALFLILLALFAMIGPACAQDASEAIFDRYPHVAVIPSFNLNSAGFSPTSQSFSLVPQFEGRHLMFQSRASYDNARKTNDNTDNNAKGRERKLDASAYYRLRNQWFFGGGAGWTKLSTTNYSKQHWYPHFGGGKDFFLEDVSFRIKCDYNLPGSDSTNGTQGPRIEFIMPSPVTGGHFFFYESLSTIFFHTTVTDPTDRVLSDWQRSQRSVGSFLQFGLMVRF